jgi:molybdate transport system substrate-binding protein
MTNPQVPVGAYTRDVLQNMSHSDAYGPGFARSVQDNVKSEEEDVRSIVAKITLGEADAGVVYTSDVTPRIAPQVQTIAIPEQYNIAASYPIATVQGAHQPELARRFTDLVLSDTGQATIAKWGLQKAS